jgi:adenine-specific DNA-methyltransferase
VDTRLFPAHWTARLLESLPFDDLDEATEGLLVQSENYQALRALAPLLSGQIHATYIDPPYNTNATEILYKNGFKQSSWISLMEERLAQARQYMHHDGVLCVTIDDYEGSKLWMTLEGRLGPGNHLGTAVIRSNPGGRKAKRKLAAQHEYAFFFAANENVKVAKWPVLPEEKTHDYQQESDGRWYEERNLRKEGQDSLATDDSERYYPIWFDPRSGRLSSTHKFSVEILPVDSSGVKRIWRRDKADIDTLYDAGDLNHKLTRFGHQVCFKFRGGSEEETPKSMWTDPKYSAGEHGSGVLKDLFGREVFPFPKSVHAVEDCCRVMTARTDASILDYFAGSGTTGHAVVNLNRADGGHRRFTLVDMGEYFNSVLVPRIAKVMYTPEWKDGKPKRLATKEEAERMPQLVKVLRLESYEEALHNVASDTNQQRTARRDHAHRSAGGDEEYRIRYLVSLRLEASDTMLNLEKLERPFDYTLEMLTDDGPKQKQADLVETFNYLYGLRVKRCETWQHEGREYRVVKATDREQRRPILVIWRDMADLKPAPEREFLEGRLRELASKGEVYDEKLINGDCAVPGIDSLDPLFKRLMTAGEDESS